MSEYAEAYFDECMALKAEIERLRAALNDIRSNKVRREEIGRRQQSAIEMAKIKRDCTIEQCARVAESWHSNEFSQSAPSREGIAAAIRALKDS